MRVVVFILLAAVAACSQQPVYRQSNEPLPVAPVEVERYLGLWHEQARLPNRFEHGCQDVTAAYARGEGGQISVTNTCVQRDGDTRIARGHARAAGEAGEGKFKVSFFWPVWADYWVLDRGENYDWAIVGEPNGQYLWVLTREERMTPERRVAFEQRITELGYRPAELVWAPTATIASAE